MIHYVKGSSVWASLKATFTFNKTRASYLARARQSLNTETKQALAARVAAFNSKNIVMTVTSGRTGTDTLSKICALPRGVVSEHEAMPDFRFVLQSVQDNAALAGAFFSNIKVPAILGKGSSTYVESSHLFCKGFLEPALAMGYRPSLVFLKRPAAEIALSLLRKTCVPGRTGAGIRFLVTPHARNFLPISDPDSLSDYQLCYWYALEIEKRQEVYQQVADKYGLHHTTIQTKQLNDPDACIAMLAELGLVDDSEIEHLRQSWVPAAHNITPPHKKNTMDFDPAKEEAEVLARLGPAISFEEVIARIAAIPTP